MIPRWQMVAIFAAVGVLVVVAFASSPYGHALLTGQCSREPKAPECRLGGVRTSLPKGIH